MARVLDIFTLLQGYVKAVTDGTFSQISLTYILKNVIEQKG